LTDPTPDPREAEEDSKATTEADLEKQRALKQERINRILSVTKEVVAIGAAVIGAAAGIKGMRTPKTPPKSP